jgi:uncharacterized membrane protein YcgQ (UPF0703/DUF1980 family)
MEGIDEESNVHYTYMHRIYTITLSIGRLVQTRPTAVKVANHIHLFFRFVRGCHQSEDIDRAS